MIHLIASLFIVLILGCNPASNVKQNSNTTVKEDAYHLISTAEFESGIKDCKVTVLDVRTPEETADGMIPCAISINYYDEDFAEKCSKLDKEKPIYVYCKVGGRSKSASKMLEESGFNEVYDLKGGMTSWMADGKPIVKPGN